MSISISPDAITEVLVNVAKILTYIFLMYAKANLELFFKISQLDGGLLTPKIVDE